MFKRFNGNVAPFADESTSTNRTVFGSETQSDDIDDNLNADFKKGWEIVGLNDNPTREDFNAMGYTLGYLTSYLYQNGVAEYSSLQEYKTNSVTIGIDGNIYQSLVDNNIGNVLADTTKWVCIASKNSIVNSIAELKTISNIESINVLGYYEKGDGGGGTFYWDATSTETDNGGTIIQATGITTGRWKRVFSGAVNVKWFGAVDNTDLTYYLLKAIEVSNNIQVNGTFNIDTPATIITTDSLYIDFCNSKITINNNSGYSFEADNVQIPINTDIPAFSNEITVPSSYGLKINDVVSLYSNQSIETQWNYKKHLTFLVVDVNGDTVTLSNKSEADFYLSSGIVANNWGNQTINIQNANFKLVGDSTKAIRIAGYYKPIISNITLAGEFGNTATWGIQVAMAYNPICSNMVFSNMVYPFIVHNCRGGVVSKLNGSYCHHVIDSALSCDTTFRDISGNFCESTFAMHPSFNLHIDGVVCENEYGAIGFRTWGGSVSNVTHSFADSIITPISTSYWQSLIYTNLSYNPYLQFRVQYDNIVSKKNLSGVRIPLTANANQECIVSNCVIYSISNDGMDGIGNLTVTNCELEFISFRGNMLNVVNSRFKGKFSTSAIKGANVGDGNYSLARNFTNCTFIGYTNIVNLDFDVYKYNYFSSCYFKDISVFYLAQYVDNTNYSYSFTGSLFFNVPLFSNHTSHFTGTKFVNCNKAGTTPVLP